MMKIIIIKHLMSSIEMKILQFRAEMYRVVPMTPKQIKMNQKVLLCQIRNQPKIARNLHQLTLMVIKKVKKKRRIVKERKLGALS